MSLLPTVAARKPYRILSHLTGIGSCATRTLNPPSLGTISRPIPNIELSMTLLSPLPPPHRAPGFQRHRHPWNHRVLLFYVSIIPRALPIALFSRCGKCPFFQKTWKLARRLQYRTTRNPSCWNDSINADQKINIGNPPVGTWWRSQ